MYSHTAELYETNDTMNGQFTFDSHQQWCMILKSFFYFDTKSKAWISYTNSSLHVLNIPSQLHKLMHRTEMHTRPLLPLKPITATS